MAPQGYTHYLRWPNYELHYLKSACKASLTSQPDLDVEVNQTLLPDLVISRPHSKTSNMARVIADLRTQLDVERKRYTKHTRGCEVERVRQAATETVFQKDVEVVRAGTKLANAKIRYEEFQKFYLRDYATLEETLYSMILPGCLCKRRRCLRRR